MQAEQPCLASALSFLAARGAVLQQDLGPAVAGGVVTAAVAGPEPQRRVLPFGSRRGLAGAARATQPEPEGVTTLGLLCILSSSHDGGPWKAPSGLQTGLLCLNLYPGNLVLSSDGNSMQQSRVRCLYIHAGQPLLPGPWLLAGGHWQTAPPQVFGWARCETATSYCCSRACKPRTPDHCSRWYCSQWHSGHHTACLSIEHSCLTGSATCCGKQQERSTDRRRHNVNCCHRPYYST